MAREKGASAMGDVVSVVEYLRSVADKAEAAQREPAMLTLDELCQRYAVAALAIHRGNKTATARALDIHISTLRQLLSRAE